VREWTSSVRGVEESDVQLCTESDFWFRNMPWAGLFYFKKNSKPCISVNLSGAVFIYTAYTVSFFCIHSRKCNI
jgi:hypothetical protein